MSRPGNALSPLSPLSMSSNDSSFVGRYEGGADAYGASIPNDPYRPPPYGNARPLGNSPPSSNHPSGSTDMSRPSGSGSSMRPPSSASSMGMSNDGRMGFGAKPNRDSGRSQQMRPEGEDALQKHYTTLKAYLQASLQDEKGNIKPNRARDKLLRLSVTQFMELSTDVYDELLRREDDRLQRVENVPRFLLPKQNFHPKRNQARQKLSTLPIERFRQLATDVFYELERRIPRLGGLGRPGSNISDASGRSRAASRPGMRPPQGQYGGPFPPGGPGPRMAPPGPMSPYGPGPNGPPSARRPSEAGSLGRPLPKQFQTQHAQSNTIVPNKSTMVEDDDMDDDEDAFGLDHVGSGLSPAPTNHEDKQKIEAQAAEIAELKAKLESGEGKRSTEMEEEKGEWTALREQLEQKNVDAQSLVDRLQQELEDLRLKALDDNEARNQNDSNLILLRQQLDQHQAENADLQRVQAERDDLRRQLQEQQSSAASSVDFARMEQLESDLAKQEKISMEVQEQAMLNLREMRELSKENDRAIEQEEKLAARISQLEKENNEWRQRYANVKAQNKHLRASTMGLGLQTGFDSGGLVRQEGLISGSGLVRDTDVTRFQLSVDELLKVARGNSTDAMLDSVKSVVVSVQAITTAVGRTEDYPTPAPSPGGDSSQPTTSVSKIKARVTGTANSLITATKQHAASHGLSPVALLDAASSNLTASVVELIKAVRIRPSSKADFDDAGFSYDDHLSPNEVGHLQIPVPQQQQSQHQPSQQANDSPSLGKKGWFGWARGGNEEASAAPLQHPASGPNGQTPHGTGPHHLDDDADYSDSEYDPYR